jgi:hypothetical protein
MANLELASLVGVGLDDMQLEVKFASWVDCDAGDGFDKDGFMRFFTL